MEFVDSFKIAPCVEKSVKYNSKINILFLFYNSFIFQENGEKNKLIIQYFLANRLLRDNYYQQAERIIQNLFLELTTIFTNDNKQIIDTITDFQCMFILLHEFNHELFKNSKIERDKAIISSKRL